MWEEGHALRLPSAASLEPTERSLAREGFQGFDLVVLTTLIGVDDDVGDDRFAESGVGQGLVEVRTVGLVRAEDRVDVLTEAADERFFVFAVFLGLQGRDRVDREVRFHRAPVRGRGFLRGHKFEVPVQPDVVFVWVDAGLSDLHDVVCLGEQWE